METEPETSSEETGFSPLSIDLILMEVLSNLSVKDLLVCALVGKKWNFFARKILADKKTGFLAVVDGYNPCKMLRDLDLLVESSVNMPFSGLNIVLQRTRGCDIGEHECIKSTGFRDEYSNLLGKLEVKELKIHWLAHMQCPAVDYVMNIFQERRSVLRGLYIRAFPYAEDLERFFNIGQDDRNNWLANLETLEIPYGINERLLFTLLDGAPKLKEIWGAINPRETTLLIDKNRAHLVKDFEFQLVPSEIQNCLNFAILKPQLQRLHTSLEGFLPSGSISSFCDILKMLLLSSSQLKVLRVDLLSLIWLSWVGITDTSRQLSRLEIMYDDTLDTCLQFFSMKKINLNIIFPKINSVVITFRRLGLDDNRPFLPSEWPQNLADFTGPSVKIVTVERSDLMPQNFLASISEYFHSATLEIC